MAQMPESAGTPEQAMPAEQGQGGSATELVARIHSDLTKLSDIMEASHAVAPEDIQQLGQITAAYRQFVEQNLGSGPGQKPQPQEAAQQGPAPAMAGAAKVQPAL